MSNVSRRELMQMPGAGIGVLAHQGLVAAAASAPDGHSGRGEAGAPQVFKLDLSRTAGQITPLLFGHNLEHTRRAVWQGLSAQMLANRKFTGASTTDRRAATAAEGFIG